MKTGLGLKILEHYIFEGCEVKVADVTTLGAPGALDEAMSHLSSYRRDKVVRFRFDKGKMLSAGAGLLLDDMLSVHGLRERDMRYVEGEHGKPEIEGHPELHFSLSHSGTLVACAMGNVPLGVDVQTFVSLRDSLVDYTLSEAEKTHLRSIIDTKDQQAYFTQLWALKESYAKATGRGLSHSFPAFDIVDGEVIPLSPLDPSARFFAFAVEGAMGAVSLLT